MSARPRPAGAPLEARGRESWSGRRSGTECLSALAAMTLCLACSSSETRAPRASATPTDGVDSHEALRAFMSPLSPGARRAAGPDAELIADFAGLGLSERDALGVHVVEGEARAITVVFRYRQAGPDESAEETLAAGRANRELQAVVAEIDAGYGALDDDLLVAVHGTRTWAFAGRRGPGSTLRYERRPATIAALLDAHLRTRPGERRPLPSLALGGTLDGELGGPPGRPSAALLQLETDRQVVLALSVAGGTEVFLQVCRGAMNPLACVDAEHLDFTTGFYDEAMDRIADEQQAVGRSFHYAEYGLPAGTYTVVLSPECDYGSTCPARGAAFTLSASVAQ